MDAREWAELTERGLVNGTVHAEEVALVLRDVELSGEVLAKTRRVLHDAGIQLDEAIDALCERRPGTLAGRPGLRVEVNRTSAGGSASGDLPAPNRLASGIVGA